MNDHSLRIIQIMQDKKMGPTQFAKLIGVKNTIISHITVGRNNPSAEVITKIVERFADIDPGWLLTGRGTMKFVTDQSENLMNDNQPDQPNFQDGKKAKPVSPLGGEKDLFEPSDAPFERLIRPEVNRNDENQQGEAVNQSENKSKIVEKEIVIYKDTPVKTIEKLIIFFSDKTFEAFLPEINEN